MNARQRRTYQKSLDAAKAELEGLDARKSALEAAVTGLSALLAQPDPDEGDDPQAEPAAAPTQLPTPNWGKGAGAKT